MSARFNQQRRIVELAAAVRPAGGLPRQLLLRGVSGDGGELGLDAALGRAAFRASGLRQPQADGAVAAGRPWDQSQASRAVVAGHGDRGDLRQTEVEPGRVWASNLPLSVKGFGSNGPGSSVVFGHNVCAYGQRVYVFGGGDGLVESLCLGLAVKQHAGGGLLRGRVGSGVAGRTAGAVDLQHRSRLAVQRAHVCGRPARK